MVSTYKLIWSDRAIQDLKNIIAYLENNWTEKEIRKFARRLERQLNIIKTNPCLFSMSPMSNKLRKAVLSKQTTVYFQIESEYIRLITLFDNRQNPKKIK